MADVLTNEEIAKLRAEQNPPTEETTTQAEDKAADESPSPLDLVKAKIGVPWDIDTFTQKGQALKVTLAKPSKPMSLFVTKILGHDSTNEGLFMYYRSMMWMTHVNGVALAPFAKRQDFEAIHELIGDEALDTIVAEVFAADAIERVVRDEVKK